MLTCAETGVRGGRCEQKITKKHAIVPVGLCAVELERFVLAMLGHNNSSNSENR
jgi:hypothetical protein